MARIIGELGSEKVLIKELKKLEIYSLNSLDDVEDHIKNSHSKIQLLKKEKRNKILREIEDLKLQYDKSTQDLATKRTERLDELNLERDTLENKLKELRIPSSNIFMRIFGKIRHWRSFQRLKRLEVKFDEEVAKPFKRLSEKILDLEASIRYLENNTDKEINKRISYQLSDKESIDKALKQVEKWLIGALGERKVVQTLAELPDSFIVINDVVLKFEPPLRTENGLRYQCQVDHVVIGPTGIFNIETKYWSERSIQNLDLRSPVDQIKVTGKGLWRELNSAIRKRHIKLNGHHWGETKIGVRNILAMVGAMPNADFQRVKLLSVDRLVGYIEYFDPVFERAEVEEIVYWFNKVS